jgi:hypothetical protein
VAGIGMMSTNESLIALKSILIDVEWILVFIFPEVVRAA